MHEGVVEKIVNGGWGLIRSPEGVVLLPYVLPEETVEYRIKDRAKGILWGEMLKILNPSEKRISPTCPYYGECGGCILQHMSYRNQLKLKEDLFKEDLKKIAGLQIENIEVKSSEPFRYRVRAKLKSTEEGKIGFIKKSTNSVYPIKSCLLFKVEMEEFLKNWNSLPQPPVYHQLDLLFNQDNRQLYVNLSHKPDRKKLEELFPRVIFTSGGNDLKNGAVSELSIKGSDYRIAPSAFFQNNSFMWGPMLETVESMLTKTDQPSIDLYCGVGFFTPLLQKYSPQVIGVENSRLSIELASQSFPAAQFHRTPVDKFQFPKAGLLLCDPPRSGLSERVHKAIEESSFKSIIYVSCNSQTFCRDLKRILHQGYKLEELQIMDLFPQSPHFEVICKLSLNPPDRETQL